MLTWLYILATKKTGDSQLFNPTTQGNVSPYNMNHDYRGMAIIFNHFKFDSALEPRNGTYKDVEGLKGALKLLGFEDEHIKVEHDLTAQQIIEYPTKISNEDREILKNSDCIVIFILSHGANDNKIFARDMTYDLHELIEQYTPDKFAEMALKPKLFIVNACRGVKLEVGTKLQTKFLNMGHDVYTDSIKLQPKEFSHPTFADILIGFSSHHEHQSLRTDDGSHYIQDFCGAISHYHREKNLDLVDIVEILTYTQYLVARRETNCTNSDHITVKYKQIPNFHSALCGKLCFTKKRRLID